MAHNGGTINQGLPEQMKNRPAFVTLAVLLAISGAVVHSVFGHSWLFSAGHAYGSDDAFISYRYANNFFNGEGLFFNKGDTVEGYSNFLYVLLMVPGFFFGRENIYIFSVAVNALLLGVAVIVFAKILESKVGRTKSLIGAFLMALNPFIWANAATGLESVLVLLIFLLFWQAIDSSRPINVKLLLLVALLSILARVDGFILPVVGALYLWFRKDKEKALVLAAFVITVMMIYTVARFLYYGDIISNTFYAKVDGNLYGRIRFGIEYLWDNCFYNLITYYFLVALLLTIVIMRASSWSKLADRVSFPVFFSVFWAIYLIYIGGDIYADRFMLPFVPAGIFVFVQSLENGVWRSRLRTNLALAVTIVLGFWGATHDGRFEYSRSRYDMWKSLGQILAKTPRNYLLAADAVGKVPYYSELRTLDMLGLNDRVIGKKIVTEKSFVIGHNKYDAEYTLSQSPELIAVWMLPSLNGRWGLTEDVYKSNYSLKYLINSSRRSVPENIIDVQNTETLSAKLVRKGFDYAVLARKDVVDSLPAQPTLDEFFKP
jgi:arabinofuranosyltransferase